MSIYVQQKNQEYWDRESEEYAASHPGNSDSSRHPSWGVWDIREAELQVLGDVRDRDLLELGCGDAHDALAFAVQGARVTAIDFSTVQLDRARAFLEGAAAEVTLREADAADLPFADESFDYVVSDYGAFDFTDPGVAVPEAARVLRPGGILAVCTLSPLVSMCVDHASGALAESLQNNYFDLYGTDCEDVVMYALTYSDWVGVGRDSGLVLESLHDLRPPADWKPLYDGQHHLRFEWARQWPAEHVYVFRKPA